MKKIKIAVIGSRDTNLIIMKKMFNSLIEIIKICTKNNIGLELRSGGANNGPDDLIRLLALEDNLFSSSITAKIYLPNERRLNSIRNYPMQYIKFIVPKINDEVICLINELHPYSNALKEKWMYEYHGRNLHIIAGDNLNNNVDCVYYSATPIKDERVKGGTGMGIAYANKLKIPSFNEYSNEGNEFINFIHKLTLF